MATVLVLVNNNNVNSSVQYLKEYHGIVQKYYDAICQVRLHSVHKEALCNCKVSLQIL